MNQKRGLTDDGDPWAPNNLLKSGVDRDRKMQTDCKQSQKSFIWFRFVAN